MSADIFQVADLINEDIMIIRYANQDGRFAASFDDGEIKGDGVLISCYGEGKSPMEALYNYCQQIATKTIVFNSHSKERRKEFKMPETLTVGKEAP